MKREKIFHASKYYFLFNNIIFFSMIFLHLTDFTENDAVLEVAQGVQEQLVEKIKISKIYDFRILGFKNVTILGLQRMDIINWT